MLKQTIFNACLNSITQKIEALNTTLNLLSNSVNNDTKSSAGDKHETSRAMMHLEQEKMNAQLNELVFQKNELEKIDITLDSKKIIKGSLIKTDKAYFFLSIGIGKLQFENDIVYAISVRSPLGSILIGLKENDVVELNKINYQILKIF